MYCPDEMKLNKLRICNIPKPKQYFMQYGYKPLPVYTGDEVVSPGVRKLDTCHELDALDNRAFEFEMNQKFTQHEQQLSQSGSAGSGTEQPAAGES